MLLASSGIAMLACATAAAAQDRGTVDVAAEADRTENASADIIVTARKRSESLMSVPVVVSALTSAEIKRNNATDLSAIGALTPTVIVAPYGANGGSSIAIRGISSPANQSGFEQAVSVAIDGVQTSNGHVVQLGFFDLAQVETLPALFRCRPPIQRPAGR
jgi:outer membrane receptor protein involved in Fe transport